VAGRCRYGSDAERSHGTYVNAKCLNIAAILIASEEKLFLISRFIKGDTVNKMILYYK